MSGRQGGKAKPLKAPKKQNKELDEDVSESASVDKILGPSVFTDRLSGLLCLSFLLRLIGAMMLIEWIWFSAASKWM